MALNSHFRNIGILFVLTVILLAYGLGAIYVEQHVGNLAAFYLILGSASLMICLIRIKNISPRSTARSRWKNAALLVLIVLLWTAFYIEINYFAYRNNKRWDLTKTKQHTLTGSTRDLIGNLRQEIRLMAFYTGLPPQYLEDLLNEYQRVSNGKIKAEIIDPIVQIGYAAQFGSTISSKEQKIFVQSANEKREVDFTNGILTEEELTNAVMRVTRKIRRVYFLIGHNEYNIHEEGDTGLKAFEALLAANHVISKRVMLGIKGEIPPDCDVLVIAGPKSHFSKKEEEIIEGYLRKGGDALFFIEHTVVTTPDKPLTEEEKTLNPSLNSILNNWGIHIADDVVVDLSSHASGDVGSPATHNYMAHRSIVNDLDYTFFIRPRSISMVKERRPTVKLAPVILTASEQNSWGETNRTLEIKFDEGVDRPGPVPIAFAIWEPKQEGDDSDTRIIVITDADFLTNAYIGQYSNARLGINAINWLSEVDYQVLFDKKDVHINRLDLTSKQKRMVGVMLYIMPLLIAVAGAMVWLRQRFV